MRAVAIGLGVVFSIAIIGVLIDLGYTQPWTGLPAYNTSTGELVRAKTLWDWLDLFIVPFVLALAAFILDSSRKRSEQRVETDRQRQRSLENYFDGMMELLLASNLAHQSAGFAHAQSVARTRTLATLRLLDGGRKAQLLQFLYEADLIHADPIVPLIGADLNGANLAEATLSRADVRGAYFRGASFRGADLSSTDLRGADFQDADFRDANLSGADLRQANLRNADLSGADLAGASFKQAILDGTKPRTAAHALLGPKR